MHVSRDSDEILIFYFDIVRVTVINVKIFLGLTFESGYDLNFSISILVVLYI